MEKQNEVSQDGVLDLSDLPIYEEDEERTIRVGGGTPHVSLACYVIDRLSYFDYVDLAYIGAAAAWQAALTLGILFHTNRASIQMEVMYVQANTDRGLRKMIVCRITKVGQMVKIRRMADADE